MKGPPQEKDLIDYENGLINIIDKTETRQNNNKFQKQLRNDIKSINKSNNLFIQTDKSRTINKMESINYKNLIKKGKILLHNYQLRIRK